MMNVPHRDLDPSTLTFGPPVEVRRHPAVGWRPGRADGPSHEPPPPHHPCPRDSPGVFGRGGPATVAAVLMLGMAVIGVVAWAAGELAWIWGAGR